MNKQDKYEHWADIAQYDLDTADVMLKSGRYLYVAFMCQQAIEKLVKGLYVWRLDREPPRTHNIYSIYKTIFGNDDKDLESQYAPFFAELLAYYISERYPSYREKLSAAVSKEKANEVLQKAKEVFRWLQSHKM